MDQLTALTDVGAHLTNIALALSCCLLCASVLGSILRRSAEVITTAQKVLWIGLAALVGGALLWGAHIAIVLAVGQDAQPSYDLTLLAAALATALVVAGAGVIIAAPRPGEVDVTSAAIGGGLFGAAMIATHYVGVAAVRFPGRIVLDDTRLAIAGAAAIALSGAAFAIGAARPKVLNQIGAVGCFLAAAAVFHVLALSATDVALNPRIVVPSSAVALPDMLLATAGAVILLLLVAFIAVIVDIRLDDNGAGQKARLQAFADLSAEGIVICEDMKIIDVNVAAARMIGLDPGVLRGRAFRDFLDVPDPDRVLSASFAKPQDTSVKTTGGEPTFVEVSSKDLQVLGRTRRVFTLRDLSDQRRNEIQIRHLAYHDPLTSLANRAAFNEALTAALRRGGEVALFCVDLDKFKEVNDVFGHASGDEVLRTAARRIVAAAPDAMVFRLGGDEFVVIGTGPDAGDADKLALRLTERLNVETMVTGNTIRCGASVGYAVYPRHGSDTDTLFANADAALYRAKADGRGLARGFAPEMDLALRERRALQQDLATAISRNEMFLHWMPQANAASGEIVGFEALLRWKHPTRGVVPPVTFIPVAEETAAIVPIGEWVLRTACQTAAGWTKPGKVAVNLSPVQFQHGDIVALVHGILLETGLAASRLELEITEGVLLDDLSGALQTLRRLKALGVQIAMDDFGTGYSSLSYLQAFPFDRIKIDASFIRTLGTSPQAKAIVRAVVALGASLHMPITAEGVETAEQRAFLVELDCEEIQGYLVGRPSPVISFEPPFERAARARRAG